MYFLIFVKITRIDNKKSLKNQKIFFKYKYINFDLRFSLNNKMFCVELLIFCGGGNWLIC
ncbi:unnamed protein product [Meloidogyne enterolobii]|uniref:Uncharacterized protein n=1 Tax=Meloidogyne enterolobii TaxID=390850 RepID=A0ACB1AW51_MELEN